MTKEFIGEYIGFRIKTEYNTQTNQTKEVKSTKKYLVTKLNDSQYLVKTTNLDGSNPLNLLLFKNQNGFLSTSLGGIDNIVYDTCSNNFIHYWSLPESNGILTNAKITLEK